MEGSNCFTWENWRKFNGRQSFSTLMLVELCGTRVRLCSPLIGMIRWHILFMCQSTTDCVQFLIPQLRATSHKLFLGVNKSSFVLLYHWLIYEKWDDVAILIWSCAWIVSLHRKVGVIVVVTLFGFC